MNMPPGNGNGNGRGNGNGPPTRGKSNNFRVFGGLLGSTEGFHDVDLTGVDSEGNIFITVTSTGEEHGMEFNKFTEKREDGLVVELDKITVNEGIWTTFQRIDDQRASGAPTEVDEMLKGAQKELFRAAVKSQT